MKLAQYKLRLNCIFVLVTQGPFTIYLEGGREKKKGAGSRLFQIGHGGGGGGGKRLYKEV